MSDRLQPEDELHCPHCRQWHPLFLPYPDQTTDAREMLFWTCRGANYFAGHIGTEARYPTRRPSGQQ